MKRAAMMASVATAILFNLVGLAAAGLPGIDPLPFSEYAVGADPEFVFSFSDSAGDAGTGVLMADDVGGGAYHATSGYITMTSGPTAGTYTLFPIGPIATPSPYGSFIADNLFFPAANPTLDVNGLLFTGGGLELNIWGNGPNNYSLYTSNAFASYPYVFEGTIGNNTASLTFTQTPEPTSIALWSLIGLGFVGIGYRRFRRK